jgi:hypothetical protein
MRVTEAVVLEPGRGVVAPPLAGPRTFAWSASGRWAEVSARVGIAMAGTGLVWWAAPHGIAGLPVAAIGLVGPLWWLVARSARGTAWRILASDQFIEAVGFGGARVRLTWDSVGEVQHFVRRTTRGPVRALRLLSVDRQREVTIDDRLSGFDSLMSLVESKVRHAGAGTPSSWGRLLWSQSVGDGSRR